MDLFTFAKENDKQKLLFLSTINRIKEKVVDGSTVFVNETGFYELGVSK